ncbi:hypothetical protein J7L67_01870, partial [bacterium]|nr:hypothetical protein [bacterium]
MITIKVIPNILSNEGRSTKKVEFDVSKKLSDYLKDYDLEDQKIIIGGEVVADMSRTLENNDEIIITPDVELGFLAFLTAGTILAPITSALAAAAPYIYIGIAMASVGYSIYSAVTSGPRQASHGLSHTGGIEDGSPTYGWDGITLIASTGVPVGIVLGKHRVGGNKINQYISTDGDKNYLNMLICLGEGELEYIDDLLINDNPVSNFSGVEIFKRYGTADQSVIPYFDQTHHVNPIGVDIEINGPGVTYTTSLSDIDAFEVYITCPNGLYIQVQQPDFNGITTHSVTFTIEYKKHSASTWSYMNGNSSYTISAKQRSAVRRIYRQEGLEPDKYDIRIIKTGGVDNELASGAMRVQAIDEIRDITLAYTGRALLGLRFLATEQLNNTEPNVTCIAKRKVSQPKVMNGSTEVDYDDYYWDADSECYKLFSDDTALTWDGSSYVNKYSSNPVWIIKDLLTNDVYGVGDYINVSALNNDLLLEMAQYCDTKTPDGNGGYEKLFKLDAVLDSATKVLDVIAQLSASFRGMAYYSAGAIHLKIDKQEDPNQVFKTYGMGNIINEFEQTWVSKKEKINVVEVQFMDEDNDYKQDSVEIEDKDVLYDSNGQQIVPRRKKVIRLTCTRLSQAVREGRYAIRAAKYHDKTISFKAGIDAVISQPGDVIGISHDVPQYGFSGRLKKLGTIPADALLHYKMDDNADNAVVVEENGNNAVFTNKSGSSYTAENSVAGKINTALAFNGNSYIDCGNNGNITGSLSISSWVKLTDSTPDNHYNIVSKTNLAYRFRVNNDGKLWLLLNDGSYDVIRTDNSYLTFDSTWYHIAVVFDSVNQKVNFYVNGVLKETKNTTKSSIQITSYGLTIGAIDVTASSEILSGHLDDVRIYDYELTAENVAYIHSLGKDRIRLDDEVIIESGKTYKLRVTFSDDTTEERTVTNSPGTYNELNLSDSFTQIPQDFDIYAFGENNKVVYPARIIKIERDNKNEVKITARTYDERIYDDSGLTLPDRNYSALNSMIPYIENLVLSEELFKELDGTVSTKVTAWFQKPTSPGDYYLKTYEKARIFLSNDEGSTWKQIGETYGVNFAIIDEFADLQTYRVAVVSVSKDGAQNAIDNSPYADITIVGKSAEPENVRNFDVQQVGTNLQLTWDGVADIDLSHYKIKKGSDWETDAVTVVEDVRTTSILLPVSELGNIRYLIKAVDTSGNESALASYDDIDVELKDTSRFITEFDLFSEYPFHLKTNNIDVHYRADFSRNYVRPVFALATQQTWQELENLGKTWQALINDGNFVLDDNFETSGSIEMQRDFDLKTVTEFQVSSVIGKVDANSQTFTIQISYSSDGTTWTSFADISTSTVYTARYVKLKFLWNTSNSSYNIYLYSLIVGFLSPDIVVVYGGDVSIPSSGKTISYGETFTAVPKVVCTITDGTDGVVIVSNKSTTSFDVTVKNLNGTAIAAEI